MLMLKYFRNIQKAKCIETILKLCAVCRVPSIDICIHGLQNRTLSALLIRQVLSTLSVLQITCCSKPVQDVADQVCTQETTKETKKRQTNGHQ